MYFKVKGNVCPQNFLKKVIDPSDISRNRMNIYAFIINIQVPHEVKNQRAKAKRTSQLM